MLKQIKNVQEFKEIIRQGISVVDFYADWCGPCKMLAPIMHELADEFDGKANIIKVDVDELRELAMEYNVSSIPLVVILKDGKIHESLLGYKPKTNYAQILNKLI